MQNSLFSYFICMNLNASPSSVEKKLPSIVCFSTRRNKISTGEQITKIKQTDYQNKSMMVDTQ